MKKRSKRWGREPNHARPNQSLQAVLGFEIQDNRWSKGVWHDGHPCAEIGTICQLEVNARFVHVKMQPPRDLRNGHLAEVHAVIDYYLQHKATVQIYLTRREEEAVTTLRAKVEADRRRLSREVLLASRDAMENDKAPADQ